MTGIRLETVQWSSLTDIDEVRPVDENDRAVLDEIQQILLRFNCSDRFGICLLHKHFDLEDDECLMEYTDKESRTSTLVVEQRKGVETGRIETMWKFGAEIQAATQCRT